MKNIFLTFSGIACIAGLAMFAMPVANADAARAIAAVPTQASFSGVLGGSRFLLQAKMGQVTVVRNVGHVPTLDDVAEVTRNDLCPLASGSPILSTVEGVTGNWWATHGGAANGDSIIVKCPPPRAATFSSSRG